ncbi:hypothetical protein Q1695_010874 [Nippostrongylus brasiliensis]|nr:hypothetical protein Q1695_010874 [Nippostrongylus brasiliensis]
MGQGGYSITEFAHRLAQAEAKYGKEMLAIIECFTNSRVDLPVKKLEDLSRARMKCARHLRKMDIKKEEYMNLWKLCNIYSATAVDVDDAMREIRNALRKRLKPKDSSRDVSAFRRLIDEYRPSKKTTTVEHQQETYDKPTSKEKQRWLELSMFSRKKDDKKDISTEDYSRRAKTIGKSGKSDSERSNTLKINVPATDAQQKRPQPASAYSTLNLKHDYTPGVYDTPLVPPPPSASRPPAPPPYPLPTVVSPVKYQNPKLTQPSPYLDNEHYDEVWTQPIFDEPHLPSSGSRSRAAPVETPQNSSAVFEPSQLLKKLAPLKDPAELLSDSAGRSPKCEPKKDSPRQISPGTMYKPIAPPRPSAPSSKSPSSLTGSSTSSSVDSVSYADVHVQCENVQAVLTPTMIEILPSPENTLSRPNRAENESDYMTLDRRGVLAKRHSIKIDNSIKQDVDPICMSGSYLLTVPGSDYSIVVNHL